MLPKLGDVVSFNHVFLKLWFKWNGYLRKDVWDEKFVVTQLEVEHMIIPRPIKYKVWVENGSSKYFMYLNGKGEWSISTTFPKYSDIQMFYIHASGADVIDEVPDSGVYCSCGGPSKKNWAGGNMFYFCTACGKEKQ